MKFMDVISGRGFEACAAQWGVRPRTVQSWYYGERQPRPRQAEKIIAAEGGDLTFADIYASRTEMAASE